MSKKEKIDTDSPSMTDAVADAIDVLHVAEPTAEPSPVEAPHAPATCPACDSPSEAFGAIHGHAWNECVRCGSVWRDSADVSEALETMTTGDVVHAQGRLRAGRDLDSMQRQLPEDAALVLSEPGLLLANLARGRVLIGYDDHDYTFIESPSV